MRRIPLKENERIPRNKKAYVLVPVLVLVLVLALVAVPALVTVLALVLALVLEHLFVLNTQAMLEKVFFSVG